ncbi:unnamed protein product [Cylicocyclus nassatus]|uniref:Uncharacterized protein n=1 Tax=Cylicocyclus nassatus TaxID=53992 RepID=A0AA36M739_CYLNA|nr:unnamed protein product [Cylicocyclus nassatus]
MIPFHSSISLDLLPYYTAILLHTFTIIMVTKLICCLKQSRGSGEQSKGWCMRRKDASKSKTFDSWQSSVADIATCEIVNPPAGDCCMGDAGLEAKIRHRTLTWYPDLKLQKVSIIRKNYMKFDLSSLPNHPAHTNIENAMTQEEMLARKARYKDKHITWESECPVFIVYGYDPCRGELDYDENTMDDLSYKEAEELEKNIDKVLLLPLYTN